MKEQEIQVFDSEGLLLESFPLSQRDKAFQYAESLEEMGIEFTIHEPSLPETLAHSLGASVEERRALQSELLDEIADHGTTCCTEQ